MKTTPICRKAENCNRVVFSLFHIMFFFYFNYSWGQQVAPVKDTATILTNPHTTTPTYLDTTDVYVCKGNVLEMKPLAPALDTSFRYEYVWKLSANEQQPLIKIDSGNKKVADMTLTINTVQQQANTFFANIDIGDIVEGKFKHYYFRVVKIHLIAKPAAPVVNNLLNQRIGDVVNLQVSSPYENTSAVEYIWYTKINTSIPIFSGPSFTIGPLVNDTAFYVMLKRIDASDKTCLSPFTEAYITLLYPIFVPNAFSPNNDGLNDVFKIEGASLLSSGKLSVYNQWGALLFQTNDMSKGWDGKVNGIPQPSGAYIYVLDAVLSNTAKAYRKKGIVALMR